VDGPDCARTQQLIDAALDGELDRQTLLALAEHRAGCPDCARRYADRRALKATLGQATRHAMPAALRRRLEAMTPPPAPRPAPVARWSRRLGWSVPAAALAASLALFLAAPGPQDGLAHDLAAAHIRSLMPDHLTDVVSSDRHTVKPWFNGRLPASPQVPDLAADGFPLVGGRLDYVGDHLAAAMVYRHGQHVINLFAWPATATAFAGRADRDGFHLLGWTDGTLAYAAVSDVAWSDLDGFQRLWTKAAATPP